VLVPTLAVFAAVVAIVTLQLRAGLREQTLRRAAETLAAVAAMQVQDAAEVADRAGIPLDEVPAALFVAVLKISKLPGVAGVRVYDANRHVTDSWMLPRSEEAPPKAVWEEVARGQAVGRLHARLSADETAEIALASTADSFVEAWVPLRRARSAALVGAAQFWADGSEVVADLAEHDRRLWFQAVVAWVAGSLVLTLTLAWALRRLDAANRELRVRSEDLQRANRELVLAAKTSALGTVTAHLMHELKNPLAGLELIVAGQTESGLRSDGGELAAASELTRRLRTMVNDVVGVLRDENSGGAFELTCGEIVELTAEKMGGVAKERGIRFETRTEAATALSGRRANLVMLVLRNLLQNALEATPAGGVVRLIARSGKNEAVEFRVEDSGSGLSAPIRARLFQPCASSKLGGSGLGLALSYQLAQQAGGKLELERSDESGTSFRLVLAAEA
jgi:signal transduction histidine kinase